MRIRHSLLTAFLITTLSVPAYAAIILHADVNLGPPEARYEAVPAAREGYYWSPGFWQWDGHQRNWINGYWVEARDGYRWAPDRWEHYETGWRFNRGHYYADKHWNRGRGYQAARNDRNDRDDNHRNDRDGNHRIDDSRRDNDNDHDNGNHNDNDHDNGRGSHRR